MNKILIIILPLIIGIFFVVGYYISRKYKLRRAFFSFLGMLVMAFTANGYLTSVRRLVAETLSGDVGSKQGKIEMNEIMNLIVLNSSLSGFFEALTVVFFIVFIVFIARRFYLNIV